MKTTKILVVALVLLSSFPFLLAQQTDANVQQSSTTTVNNTQVNQSSTANAQASRKGVQAQGTSAASGAAADRLGSANGSANGSAAGAAELRPVQGELVGKLDSKTAKPGDPVVFKTTEKTRTADGTVIPKGTRIMGHVTDVQAHGKGSEDSHLGVVFDRAELKSGQTMAIHSAIQSVSPSASAMAMQSNMASSNDDLFASPAGGGPRMGGGVAGGGVAGGGMASGGARSGGGLIGGGGGGAVGGAVSGAGSLAGNSVHTVGSATGNAGAGVGSTAGSGLNGAVGAAGSAAGNASGNLRGANVNGAAAGRGLLAAQPTGIPGLMLAGDASGATSGMLSASRRNVHLDSGTQMVLGVSSVLAQ